MSGTTLWCTWQDIAGTVTPTSTVYAYLGQSCTSEQLAALTAAYTEAVDEALPHGWSTGSSVVRSHNRFYGPAPRPADAVERLRDIIASVDLADLAAKL
jgi:hypothetical protein